VSFFFPGTAKPLIVNFADDIEIRKVEYPLAIHLLVRRRTAEVPESLRRLLDHDFPERDEMMSRIRQRHSLAARLRTWCEAFETWNPSERVRRIAHEIDCWAKVFIVCAALYLLLEIARGFRPLSEIARGLGGGK
jgi:hypothetical protein